MKRRITIFALLLSAFSAIGPSVFAAGPDNVMYMRLTPVGYRLGATDDIKDYDPSVVTVSPGEVSNVTSNKPVTLTAALDRDYKVICWQKFADDPTHWTGADPIEEFGKESETVSVEFNSNVPWMYVTVVVKYDPVRTVKTSLSSFAKGTITVSPATTNYQNGDDVTLTVQPAKGYSFVRWSDGDPDHSRTLTVDDDIDLKAYIEPISSKVTFSAESDAVLDVTSKRVSYDNAYGELPTPVRYGLVFTGWIDADGQVVTAKTTVDRTSDHTLSAQWEIPPESYMVVFEPNGGTGVEMRVTQTFEVGVAQKLRVNTFYYPGHVFVGWNQYKAAEEKQYSDEQIVKDLASAGTSITFYAVWRVEKTAYTVQFDANGGTGKMLDQQFAGGEEKHLSGCAFKREGWNFLGWSTDPNALEPAYQDRERVQDLTTETKLTLYAVWTKNPVYYIEYKLMKDDKDLWKSETVEQGKEYNLVTNKPIRVGHNPSGWKNGDKSYAYGDKLTSQDLRKMAGGGDTITFVADWTPIHYKVSFWWNDGTGRVVCTNDYTYGDRETVLFDPNAHPAFKRDGYKFNNWSTNALAKTGEIYTRGSYDLAETEGDVVDLYAIWESDAPTPPDPPTPVMELKNALVSGKDVDLSKITVSVSNTGAWTATSDEIGGVERKDGNPDGSLNVTVDASASGTWKVQLRGENTDRTTNKVSSGNTDVPTQQPVGDDWKDWFTIVKGTDYSFTWVYATEEKCRIRVVYASEQ